VLPKLAPFTVTIKGRLNAHLHAVRFVVASLFRLEKYYLYLGHVAFSWHKPEERMVRTYQPAQAAFWIARDHRGISSGGRQMALHSMIANKEDSHEGADGYHIPRPTG
jgi:hypothetical protein